MSAVAKLTAQTFHGLSRERDALRGRDHEVLRAQIRIAAIPSPTFSEGARGAWVGERLREAGWDVRTDDMGNVVASAGRAGAPAVAVCAHLDTVYAPGAPAATVCEGTRVTGPGICDNSRGLAALIAIAGALRHRMQDLPGPIHLVATTGEEGTGDLRGARHYVERHRPAAFIALDGAGDERIVNTALGARRFRISFHGPGGHSWSAFGIANPVHAAARCAAAIAGVRVAADTSLSVTRMGGGVSVNAIADDAWLEVDARGTSESVLEGVEREVRAAAQHAARGENERRTGGPALRFEVARIGQRASGGTPERSALVAAAVEATRLVGRRPDLGTASTDANAAVAAGIPAIAIGAGGRGGDVHSRHEWFDATDAWVGVERALTIVAAVARAAALER